VNRRVFYIALGATVGVLVFRRLTRTAQRLTPAGVQESLTGALGDLADAVREFGADVRAGMAEREVQLRTELGLDGSHDVVDADTYRPGPPR
jgi:chromosome condensin MukBEF MukE localization factor